MITGFYVTFNLWMAVAILMLFIGTEGKLFSLLAVLVVAGINYYFFTRSGSNHE